MITTDEKILRMKCEDATVEEAVEIIAILEKELENSAKLGAEGIGLAAVQCAINKNVAIIRLGEHKIDLVNCKIKNKYDLFLFKGEGCLSFPNRIENTMRYNEIHIVDNLVYPNSFIATGLLAVAIQHELDHLNNVLLPDIAIKQPKKNKQRPNDSCECKSGLKFKKCCGR